MKRTKPPQKRIPSFTYPQEDEPLVISKALMDTLLAEDKSADIISLYCFYYYTAKWQKTNQPKATGNYCMQGLGIGFDKLHKAQLKLIELGLIEKLLQRDKSGKIQGWFIKVNFIWKRKTVKRNRFIPDIPNDSQIWENPDQVKPRSKKSNTNALNNNNINALNANTPEQKSSGSMTPLQERNEQYLPLVKHLSSTVQTSKNIIHTTAQLKTWSNDIRQLVENNKIDIPRIKKALRWYRLHIGEQYVPVIESGSSFKNKFINLENAMQRNNNTKPNMILEYGKNWHLEKDGEYYAKDGEMFTG